MKKMLFVLLIMLLVIGLIACGKSIGEKAAENMIEEIMEKEGVEVDVDVDDGGDTVTIETEEGGMTIEGDEGGMPWPNDKLPGNVPELKGVKVVTVIDAGSGIMIGFEGCDKNNVDAYIKLIKSNGWNVAMDMESDGTRIIMAGNSNDEFLQFGWNSEDGSGEITYGSS